MKLKGKFWFNPGKRKKRVAYKNYSSRGWITNNHGFYERNLCIEEKFDLFYIITYDLNNVVISGERQLLWTIRQGVSFPTYTTILSFLNDSYLKKGFYVQKSSKWNGRFLFSLVSFFANQEAKKCIPRNPSRPNDVYRNFSVISPKPNNI